MVAATTDHVLDLEVWLGSWLVGPPSVGDAGPADMASQCVRTRDVIKMEIL